MNDSFALSPTVGHAGTRLGKVARLPLAIRTELNQRLNDGQVGARLVEWLNALPEVRAVLEAEFGGRAISVQNLSEWKKGGYEDWLRRKEVRDWVQMLSEEGTAAGKAWHPGDLAEELAMFALVRMGQLLQNVPAEMSGPEECKRVLAVTRELTQMRKANAAVQRAQAAADRVDLAEERLEIEQERFEEAELEHLKAKVKAEQERAEHLRQQVEFYTKWDEEHGRTPAKKPAEPTEAIRPNPTGSNHQFSEGKGEELPTNNTNKAKERRERGERSPL